jgi:hypothetical protein
MISLNFARGGLVEGDFANVTLTLQDVTKNYQFATESSMLSSTVSKEICFSPPPPPPHPRPAQTAFWTVKISRALQTAPQCSP